jgi:hypothetical protein
MRGTRGHGRTMDACRMDRRNPFDSGSDFGSWLLGAVVAVALGAGGLWLLALGGVQEDVSATFTAPTPDPPPPAGYVAFGPSDSAPAAAPADAVVVYSCVRDGQYVYSDQPCGAGGETRAIDLSTVNTYTPSAVDTTPVFVAQARRSLSAPAEQAAVDVHNAALCRSIEQEIERIDARMRAGYRSQEGEYWRGRWHAAKARYHAAGCTWRD